MAKINTKAAKHGSRTEHYADATIIRYNEFPEATKLDKDRLKKTTEAYNIINKLDKKIDLQGPCNKYFKTLPKGKTFRHFWRDDSIFINFSPSLSYGFYGATHSNDKDICISAWCLDTTNRWVVAATMVHEFAHIAGAPGGASHKAEKAVDKCSFGPQYNPKIIGSIKELGAYLETLA